MNTWMLMGNFQSVAESQVLYNKEFSTQWQSRQGVYSFGQ